MDHGSMFTTSVNVSMASDMNLMPNSLADGFQLEVRPVCMNTSILFLVNILTPENPRWIPVCAGESPTLALKNACACLFPSSGAIEEVYKATLG